MTNLLLSSDKEKRVSNLALGSQLKSCPFSLWTFFPQSSREEVRGRNDRKVKRERQRQGVCVTGKGKENVNAFFLTIKSCVYKRENSEDET